MVCVLVKVEREPVTGKASKAHRRGAPVRIHRSVYYSELGKRANVKLVYTRETRGRALEDINRLLLLEPESVFAVRDVKE